MQRTKDRFQKELDKAKSSEFPQVKRFIINRELDIERASIKAMKNWIKIIKEIKKKS